MEKCLSGWVGASSGMMEEEGSRVRECRVFNLMRCDGALSGWALISFGD